VASGVRIQLSQGGLVVDFPSERQIGAYYFASEYEPVDSVVFVRGVYERTTARDFGVCGIYARQREDFLSF
jgi:hypothetical protein